MCECVHVHVRVPVCVLWAGVHACLCVMVVLSLLALGPRAAAISRLASDPTLNSLAYGGAGHPILSSKRSPSYLLYDTAFLAL